MKKILILAYFYPPANFVGGNRIASWAKYLRQFGYYPIIITRNWNLDQSDLTHKIHDNTFTHETYPTHEVYRLPYHQSLRDRLNDFPKNKSLSLIRKALTVVELILSNFVINYIPYANMFHFAKKIIRENPELKTLIVSGRPFQLFYFAYLLKKETGINWIADYRDEWNTHSNRKATSTLENLIHYLEHRSEIKWTSNCKAFLTVSDHWLNNISKLINKPGYKVMNGYDPSEYTSQKPVNGKNQFVVTYSGTLYPSQRIDIFISAFKQLIDKFKDKLDLRVNFIGITMMPKSAEKVRSDISGYEKYFLISDRITKQKVIDLQMHSDVLLTTGYENMKGWYPVKIFEYYASERPVLLCPSDDDVIEEFIIKTGCGFIANSVSECYNVLEDMIEKKLKGIPVVLNRNHEAAMEYTRENQVRALASVILKIESGYLQALTINPHPNFTGKL